MKVKIKVKKASQWAWNITKCYGKDKKLTDKEITTLANRISKVLSPYYVELFDTATVTVNDGNMILEAVYKKAKVTIGYYKEYDNYIYHIIVTIRQNGKEETEDLKVNSNEDLGKIIKVLIEAVRYRIASNAFK